MSNRRAMMFSLGGVVSDISTNLVAYYKLEDNFLDSKGLNNASVSNISYVSGLVSKSALFVPALSSNAYAQYPTFNFSGGSKFSYVIAMKLASLPSSGNIYHPIMIQSGSLSGTFDKGIRVFSDGSIGFFAFDGAGKTALSSSSIVSIGVWQIFIAVFNGSNLKLYLNNTEIASIACSGSFAHTSPRLVLSHFNAGASVYYDGELDEIAIYNIDLSLLQISAIVDKLSNNQHII